MLNCCKTSTCSCWQQNSSTFECFPLVHEICVVKKANCFFPRAEEILLKRLHSTFITQMWPTFSVSCFSRLWTRLDCWLLGLLNYCPNLNLKIAHRNAAKVSSAVIVFQTEELACFLVLLPLQWSMLSFSFEPLLMLWLLSASGNGCRPNSFFDSAVDDGLLDQSKVTERQQSILVENVFGWRNLLPENIFFGRRVW